ncbi:hypothetical protein Aam_046_052 [Acidocella aminolytica 101 = DSM 11237]|uniref:Uncharacterized protein n=1 Tax=Acidocella aminolytica 101 = DSM 11237 TaxID=1120923 RepID=A0A0D6PGA6_9PROT|nr:hypothetical protein Aam_046_052 [Acidocella aminolytica 101 = DSM 11237]GBQ36263.1 hypothetical protein AA11237_1196 [Acidocella aminolytica 101 = DSM 11237]
MTYGEKLSIVLQANWAEFAVGNPRWIPPALIRRMIGEGDEYLIPAVLVRVGPAYKLGLDAYVDNNDPCVKTFDGLSDVLYRLRLGQAQEDCPPFSGISDNRQLDLYSIYYVLATEHQSSDDEADEDWALNPRFVVDFDGEAKPWQYWVDLAYRFRELSYA